MEKPKERLLIEQVGMAMIRKILAAAALAGAMAVGAVGPAAAGDATTLYAFDDLPLDGVFAVEPGWDAWRASDFGSWSLGPSAGFRTGRADAALIGGLGFRGAAKVDSRLGAIYSRLSLSFQHEFQSVTGDRISGLPGASKNGYYADQSDVDLMMLDADFALRMSPAVTGFVAYDAEIDPGSAAEHQVVLRLKFAF